MHVQVMKAMMEELAASGLSEEEILAKTQVNRRPLYSSRVYFVLNKS